MPAENSAVYIKTLSSLGTQPKYKVIDDKDEAMLKLLLQNKQHLNKAVETPAEKGSLQDYIGDYGTGHLAKSVLTGNFDPNQSKHMHEGLMKAPLESTSVSHSGRYYGYYKTLLDNNNLCIVHAEMMTMPYVSGFTPIRWEKAIDCVLEKMPATPRWKDCNLL
eukprot:14619892-Ditylum_brightwellii.AAC.1